MLPRSSPDWILRSQPQISKRVRAGVRRVEGWQGRQQGRLLQDTAARRLLAWGASYLMSSCESPTPPGLQRTLAILFLSPPSSAPAQPVRDRLGERVSTGTEGCDPGAVEGRAEALSSLPGWLLHVSWPPGLPSTVRAVVRVR